MNSLQEEINDLIRKLGKVADNAKVESRRALGEGAKPLIAAIQAKAPVSPAPHFRYKNGVAIEYKPGNLRRSIRKLVFRRSSAIFVGPKVDKSGTGSMPDGYYAHFVEFGTVHQSPQPFVRPAAESVGPVALEIAARALKRQIEKYGRTLGA